MATIIPPTTVFIASNKSTLVVLPQKMNTKPSMTSNNGCIFWCFLKKLGNPYYLVTSDQDGKSSVFFGVYGIPETILIDKDLKIIKKYIGPIDNNDVKKILKIVGAKWKLLNMYFPFWF